MDLKIMNKGKDYLIGWLRISGYGGEDANTTAVFDEVMLERPGVEFDDEACLA